MERSIRNLPLSKLCAVPFALQNRVLFEGGEKGDNVPRKGEEEGWPAKGAKRKKGRVKTSQETDSWNLLKGRANHEVHTVN